MSTISVDKLIKILNKNGFKIEDDFSILFVSDEEHKEKYEETRDYHIANGRTLNIDLDENENVLSIGVIKFSD
jgi:hypothetical protein